MTAPIDIARRFYRSAFTLEPLGNGHINDTYLVATHAEPFVLQKINSRVFPQPALIMANLGKLNRHVEEANAGDHQLKLPKLIPAETGDAFIRDAQGECWRALSYIPNTESLEVLTNLSHAQQVGNALGQFHRLTRTLDAEALDDTLPGFHIAPDYLKHYQDVKSRTAKAIDDECEEVINRFQDIVHDLESAKEQGLLAVRTTHGDPKLNNFLFDKDSGKIISLIDLDTVKPGLIHYDIGDCIRSSCHNPNTGEFDLQTCGVILSAYLQEMGRYLTASDYDYLYSAIRLIPFELGLRFYTDYLDGNRYFKVTEPDENLHRALEQFRLFSSIVSLEDEIKIIINRQKM
ncbi:MAG: aminoglycoside phosphotransferase family protein [Methylococcaceae bacterium]|nr:aminoglycoside phosphotransferase family protein [Methylococcaceae bacterium]